MTAVEYADWKSFYQMSPWGCEVDDHRFGLLLSLVGQVAGGKWHNPRDWFIRTKTVEEERKHKENVVLAEQMKLAFRTFSENKKAREVSAEQPE